MFPVRVSSGCQYSMRFDRMQKGIPEPSYSSGVVHRALVMSNIKTANGCEPKRQLELGTVFAETVACN